MLSRSNPASSEKKLELVEGKMIDYMTFSVFPAMTAMIIAIVTLQVYLR